MLLLVLFFLTYQGAAFHIPHARRDESAWIYQGCYADSVDKRTLAYNSNRDYDVQTVDTCTTHCNANNFNWAGVEYGSECYCDYQLPSTAVKQPDSDCSMPCVGNASEVCGNANRLSVYSGSVATSSPSINPGPDGWAFQACYSDSSNARTLDTPQNVAGGSSRMTVAQCTAVCESNGYTLAGVEYGSECYCDSEIRNAASTASSGCDMLCFGNTTEYCGGHNRVQVYRTTAVASPPPSTGVPSGWKTLGCFTDNGNARTLATQQEVPGGYTNMTIEGCLAVCGDKGFSIGGLEYSQECYCGKAIKNPGACASDQSTCYMPCKGNTVQVCGGSDRLNVYYAGDGDGAALTSCVGGPSSSTSSTVTPKTSTSSSSSSGSSTISSISLSTISSSSQTSSSSTISPSSSSTLATSSASPSSTVSTSTASSVTTTRACTPPTGTACPAFWSTIVADLAPDMRDASGQCTSLARAAIRFAFHDAATFSNKLPFYAPAAGGADGSLLLSPTEILRADNAGLGNYHATLLAKYNTYKSAGICVSAADLIQVAGSMGVLACPGGRIGRVLVNRAETSVEAPDGLLPAAFGPGSDHDTLFALFADKGFSARDLAALIGAHSTSIANFQTAHGMPVGTPQDTTPSSWDVEYYSETIKPPTAGMARFDSDVNLSNASTTVGKQFVSFVGAQGAWGASFSSAWQAMTTLGILRTTRFGLGDCTAVVAAALPA